MFIYIYTHILHSTHPSICMNIHLNSVLIHPLFQLFLLALGALLSEGSIPAACAGASCVNRFRRAEHLQVDVNDVMVSSLPKQMWVFNSKNSGTPNSSILIGFYTINHPFSGTPIFGNTHVEVVQGLCL